MLPVGPPNFGLRWSTTRRGGLDFVELAMPIGPISAGIPSLTLHIRKIRHITTLDLQQPPGEPTPLRVVLYQKPCRGVISAKREQAHAVGNDCKYRGSDVCIRCSPKI